jgi:putative addiction module antidote
MEVIKVKITTIGNSAGIVLPKEVLSKLRAEKGDTLYLIPTPEGFKLTPYDPEFEAQVTAARQVMRQYRNALRELGK